MKHFPKLNFVNEQLNRWKLKMTNFPLPLRRGDPVHGTRSRYKTEERYPGFTDNLSPSSRACRRVMSSRCIADTGGEGEVINYESVARHRNPINVASKQVLVSEAQCKKEKKNGIESA